MSFGAKFILFVTLVPGLAALGWALLRQSMVVIAPGRMGLLVIRGRPTDKVLLPGPHWVPALRKRTAVDYPSVELSYRAMAGGGTPTTTESYGPPLHVTLGDRAQAVVSYTVRFQLEPDRLRTVHERFGQDGIWPIVRDDSARAIVNTLANPGIGLDSVFGEARGQLEQQVGEVVREALDADCIRLTAFSLGTVDLGRAGDVIQAVVRARLEREREDAESATRVARVQHDAELAPYLATIGDAALRYRQTDVWRDLAQRSDGVTVAVPGSAGTVIVPAELEAAAAPAEAGQQP
jgi:SPFH domain / Band 7 family